MSRALLGRAAALVDCEDRFDCDAHRADGAETAAPDDGVTFPADVPDQTQCQAICQRFEKRAK
jgi:hypothetical protein